MKKITVSFLALILSMPLFSAENDYLRPIGRAQEAKTQRRQGGESMPPLPLPATPLRRSEKKRPPSPAALIGKVVWGSYLDYTSPEGYSQRVFDWNMVPADCQMLLRNVKDSLHLEYKMKTVDLASFSGDPAELPILFFSGGRTIRFTQEERLKLRKYLLDGGTVIFDSVAGSPYFFESAVSEMRKILPESPVRKIEPDHAVYRMIRNTGKLKMNNEDAFPNLYGVYSGSRLAVFISPYGMGPGWDNVRPVLIRNAKSFNGESSRQLGVNIVSYVIGWYENGQTLASASSSPADKTLLSGEKILFTQIKTDGLWNSDPGAETRFMNYLAKNLNVDAGSSPLLADPATAPLEDYPFLYLSGIGQFTLSSRAVQKLKDYLADGGFLFINNTLGMNEFDASVKSLAGKVFPGKTLEKVPENHFIFTKGPFQFRESGFSESAKQKYPGRTRPLLYGIKGPGGDYAFLYSPVDMAGGWLGSSRPGSVVYDESTALHLGADIIVYFSTR